MLSTKRDFLVYQFDALKNPSIEAEYIKSQLLSP